MCRRRLVCGRVLVLVISVAQNLAKVYVVIGPDGVVASVVDIGFLRVEVIAGIIVVWNNTSCIYKVSVYESGLHITQVIVCGVCGRIFPVLV